MYVKHLLALAIFLKGSERKKNKEKLEREALCLERTGVHLEILIWQNCALITDLGKMGCLFIIIVRIPNLNP